MLNDKPIKWFLSFRNHWRWTELWQLAQKHQNQFVFWLISRLFTGFNIYFLCDLPHKMRPFSVWLLHRPDNANQLIWLHDFSVWIFIKSDGQLLWSFVLSFEFHFDCVRQAFPFLPLNHIVFIERMANIYIAVDLLVIIKSAFSIKNDKILMERMYVLMIENLNVTIHFLFLVFSQITTNSLAILGLPSSVCVHLQPMQRKNAHNNKWKCWFHTNQTQFQWIDSYFSPPDTHIEPAINQCVILSLISEWKKVYSIAHRHSTFKRFSAKASILLILGLRINSFLTS